MKKINKKFLVSIIAIIFVISLTILLFKLAQRPDNVDSKIDKIETKEPIVLESPRELIITNGVLTWSKVTNALEYVVCINDLEYTTSDNFYNLDSTLFENADVSVYAKGYGNYLSSIKSIKRHYIRNIDNSEISKIEQLFINNLNNHFSIHLNDDFKELIYEIASELYLEGLDSQMIENIINDLNDLGNSLSEEINVDIQIKKIEKIFSLDINNYAKALLIKDYLILLLEAYSNAFIFDYKYDELNNELQKIKDIDIEIIAFSIRYLDSLDDIINNQILIFLEELYNIIVMKIQNSTNGIETIYDFMAVKDQMIDNLYQLVPNFEDYEYTIDIFSKLYSALLPARIDEYNLVDVFRYKFHEVYLDNHKLLSFCKYFNADDFNEFANNIVKLYHSFGGEEFEKNVSELYQYYEEGMYELLILEIVKLGFTEDGEYDFESYNKLRNGLTKLLTDLNNEDYQYLETAIDDVLNELFDYLKKDHHLTILVNPLIQYLSDGGNYINYFIEQFNLNQYFYLEEGKTIDDLVTIVKDWQEEDLNKIKQFDFEQGNLNDLINDLRLTGILVIKDQDLKNLVSDELLHHLSNLIDELNDSNNMVNSIQILLNHFEFNEIIMPLVNKLLGKLDERYGLNIDYAAFSYNLLTNLGCDIPMILLNISEIIAQFEDIKNNFELNYLPPLISVSEKDLELVKSSIQKNLIYFVFGEEVAIIYETFDDFSSDLEFVLNELKNQIPDDLYNELVDKISNLFNLDEQILNKVKDLFTDEYLSKIKETLNSTDWEQIIDWYQNNSEYKEQIDNLLRDISTDLINIFDEVLSYDNIMNEENKLLLEKLDQYLIEYNIQLKDSLEKLLEQYEKLKEYDFSSLLKYLKFLI